MEHTLGLYRLRNEEYIKFPGDGESWLNISDYKYSATRMGNPPTISATIEWKDCLDNLWDKDVFVQFRGEKYFVNGIPSSSYDNTKSTYTHSVEFVSERSMLSRVYFLDVIQVPNPDNATEDATISDSSDFSFSGNINDLAERINIALNYAGIGSDGGYNVVVDQDVVLEDKLFTASNQTIADILNSANETYNVPYYFVGKTIHFGYYQDILPTSLEYGANKSLLSISKNSSNNDIITKITGFGSDRNVPYYYPNPTPKGFVSMVYNTDFSHLIGTYPEIVDFYKFWNFFEFGELLTYNTRIYKSYVPLMYHRGSSVPNYSGFSEWYSPDGIEVDSSHFWSFQIPVENITTDEKKFVLDVTVYDVLTNTVYTNYRIERAAFYSEELERGEYFTIESNRKVVYDFGTDVVSEESYDAYLTIKFNSSGTYRVLVSKRIEPAWESNIKSGMYQPEDFGIKFHSGPYMDDVLSMKLDYRINTQSRLMPSIYRHTNGRSRWIYAYGSEYENEYSSNHPMEYIHTDDEIFPSIKEITNSAGQRIDIFSEIAFDTTDNNEVYPEGHKYAGKYKHPYFFAKLKKLDGESGFNLFQHAIEGQPMTISFTSGHTASCEFKIAVDESSMKNTVQVDEYGNLKRDLAGDVLCNRGEQPRYEFIERQQDTSKYEVWIALEKEDSTMGVMMPDTMSNIVPTNEDTFVILGIHLPEAYFLAAERRLDDALKKYMLENNSHKFTYSAKLSSIFLKENPDICDILNENTKVPLIYNGEDVEWLMVESYNYAVKSGTYLPEISITLNDNIKVAMSKSAATSKAVSTANANASKSQAMAASARHQSSSTAAKTQSIERRVESLEQNSNNITVEKLKTQVSANSSDIYELDERVTAIENSGGGGGGGTGSTITITSSNSKYIGVTKSSTGEFTIIPKVLSIDDYGTSPDESENFGLAKTEDVANKIDLLKVWTEQEFEVYLPAPSSTPSEGAILVYDANNGTVKDSNYKISTTTQDLEHADQSHIPTCAQVSEFVADTIGNSHIGDLEDRVVNGEKSIKTTSLYLVDGVIEDDSLIYALPTAPQQRLEECDDIIATNRYVDSKFYIIPDITINDIDVAINNGENNLKAIGSEQYSEIRDAVNSRKQICIGIDNGVNGFTPVSAFTDDFVYISFLYNGFVYNIDFESEYTTTISRKKLVTEEVIGNINTLLETIIAG